LCIESVVQLAIVSDTHIPAREEEIPESFRDRIAEADHVVHAGDFETPDVLADLRSLATELTAVQGNVDPKGIGLPSVAETTLGGVTFVVTHGTLNPVERAVHLTDGMVMSREDWLNAIADTARTRTRAWANDRPVVGIGGHSHDVEDEVHEGIRLLNPGSATGANPAEQATMMTAEVADAEVDVTVHER
jgi:putative phosphoesterase